MRLRLIFCFYFTLLVLLFSFNFYFYLRYKTTWLTIDQKHPRFSITRKLREHMQLLQTSIRSVRVESKQTKEANFKKFIVYECHGHCGGHSDRIKGIFSSYAWSLITNRTFLINITEPCHFAELMRPNDVQVNWNADLTTLLRSGQLRPNYTKIVISKVNDPKYRLDLRTLDIRKIESDKDMIGISTNLEWLDSLTKNKALQPILLSKGYKPPNYVRAVAVYKLWYNKLFRLAPKLKQKYDEFMRKAKPNNNTALICVQVRIGGRRPNVRHDAVINKRENTKYFWKFVKEKFITKTKRGNYRIFVTTDTESVEQEAFHVFDKRRLVKISGDFTHLDKEKGYGKNCSRFEKVILDFHVIKECDMLLASASGYGRFANYNRPRPHHNYAVFVNETKIVVY
jgi:hypothetical protein